MQAEFQWATFSMTPPKWVTAAGEFNRCLAELNQSQSQPVVDKNPQALMDKLGEVEAIVTARMQRGDFKCTY
jgi:hypothetical protein